MWNRNKNKKQDVSPSHIQLIKNKDMKINTSWAKKKKYKVKHLDTI